MSVSCVFLIVIPLIPIITINIKLIKDYTDICDLNTRKNIYYKNNIFVLLNKA